MTHIPADQRSRNGAAVVLGGVESRPFTPRLAMQQLAPESAAVPWKPSKLRGADAKHDYRT